MDNRVLESGASATPPAAPSTPSVGFPTKGNPTTATPASKGGVFWHYQIGEELRAVLAAAGITPSTSDLTQLLQAMNKLYASGSFNISASVATNALTGTLQPCKLDFRNASLTSGAPVNYNLTAALSCVVPSGATLGTANGVAARLVWLVAYNAGSPVLCVVNLAGGVQLDETNLISPTTISAGATSAGVIYSASAVAANSPYKVVGVTDITEAAAGTWATAPTLVQGIGSAQVIQFPRSMVRVQGYNASGTTNLYINRYNNVLVNQGVDITYADSATLGATFTVNRSGVYAISKVFTLSLASYYSGITCNTTQPNVAIWNLANNPEILSVGTAVGANTLDQCAWVGWLNAGDVIRSHDSGIPLGTSYPGKASFTIARVG